MEEGRKRKRGDGTEVGQKELGYKSTSSGTKAQVCTALKPGEREEEEEER
jgi:hypothetical protein